jgi:hypothetical protein
VERGVKGTGRHVYIPHTREALTCWGYMQAMQDLSVLADQEGDRIMGACPPEKMTTLMLIQLFGRASFDSSHPVSPVRTRRPKAAHLECVPVSISGRLVS